jgi:hypothetical protein
MQKKLSNETKNIHLTSKSQVEERVIFWRQKTAKRAGKVVAIFSKFRLVQKLLNGTAQCT